MLFSSLEFLVLFLPLTLVIALLLRGQPLLRWIAFSSIVFYAFAGHWWFIVPMLLTTVVDFWVAIAIEGAREKGRRRWLLAVSLAGNLGMLAYFKYSGLLVRTAEQALTALGLEESARFSRWLQVILPAGISFYTFQTL
jgi:D-alanyl-lipoteichoic acid acyltransferase DltB (MBOAT superfamily)